MSPILAGAIAVIVVTGLAVWWLLQHAADRVARAEAKADAYAAALAIAQDQAEIDRAVIIKADEWRATLAAAQSRLESELARPLPAPVLRIIERPPETAGGPPREAKILDFSPVFAAHRERVGRVRDILADATASPLVDYDTLGPA